MVFFNVSNQASSYVEGNESLLDILFNCLTKSFTDQGVIVVVRQFPKTDEVELCSALGRAMSLNRE